MIWIRKIWYEPQTIRRRILIPSYMKRIILFTPSGLYIYLKCTSDVLKDVVKFVIYVKYKHDIGFQNRPLFSCFLVFPKLVKWIIPTEEILLPVLSSNNCITSFDDLWESGIKSKKHERKEKAFRILTYSKNVSCKRPGYQDFIRWGLIKEYPITFQGLIQ